jgi:phage-related protein
VRVRVGQRQLRLLYAEVSDGPILLALHFFQKQRQVETRHIDLASGRLRDWEARPG